MKFYLPLFLYLCTAPFNSHVSALEIPRGLHGYYEGRYGQKTAFQPWHKQESISEIRLQLDKTEYRDDYTLTLRTDFLFDDVDREGEISLEKGEGAIDLREFNLLFYPQDNLDIKIGRQILTWGTGDMLFINDLFPKDWVSFFSGRDNEYLKAPSDAVKISWFQPQINMDLVFTPRFDADRFISGERISYYNENVGVLSGTNAIINTEQPDSWFNDNELALRFYKNINGNELALYAYRGFWKSPAGFNSAGQATFPELDVWGFSSRKPIGKGIGNIELGYYNSADDKNGSNPFIKNSELRALIGYQWELYRNFTAGLQFYVEHMNDYSAYKNNLPTGFKAKDQNRQVTTLRLSRQLMNENLLLSLFTFYSPTDKDAYLRPQIHYKIDDQRKIELGANIFLEDEEETFFGQFHRNNNIYLAYRYSF